MDQITCNYNNNIYNILNFKKGLFSRFNKKLTAFEWQVINIKKKIYILLTIITNKFNKMLNKLIITFNKHTKYKNVIHLRYLSTFK